MHGEDSHRHPLGLQSLDDAEQVGDRSRQPIRLGDDEGVSGSKPVQGGFELGAMAFDGTDVFGEDGLDAR